MGVNKLYNVYQAGKQIGKTIKSPITHAKNIIKSTFTKSKKPKIGGQEKSKTIKQAVKIKKEATKLDDKISKQFTEGKSKVKEGVLDRKDIIGGAKNRRDSKRLLKKADEFVKSSLKGFKKGGPVDKKNKKFPDHSGDGKITQKDILMAKGVIPKPKSKKKVI